MELRGRVALVTGSASGIGAGIARRLAADGAHVVLSSRSNHAAGRRLADELPQATYAGGDVRDPSDAERLVQAASQGFGRLDVLVNNAGTTHRIPLPDLEAVTAEVWRDILDVNVIGTWNMVRAAAAELRRSGEAVIINVTSVAGLRPMGSSIPYSVSKAGLNHMTELLAKALGPEIRVNAVAPGFIDTRWNAGQADHITRATARAPAQRVGTVEDVAEACLGLITSSYVTGAVVPVDGGLRLVT